MTGIEKIAISVPQALLQRVRRAVARGEAASVSAYFTAAAEEKSKHDDLGQLLGEMLAETGGPLTDRERHNADQALGLPAPATARTRVKGVPRSTPAARAKR